MAHNDQEWPILDINGYLLVIDNGESLIKCSTRPAENATPIKSAKKRLL